MIHSSKASGAITTTSPHILLCWAPQYSVQRIWYRPGLVAVNQVSVYRPGWASIFTRKAGMKTEWMTSREVMSSRTGRLAGTWSTPIEFGPSG